MITFLINGGMGVLGALIYYKLNKTSFWNNSYGVSDALVCIYIGFSVGVLFGAINMVP